MDFTTRYAHLNDNQKEAVDCIDGPVMVIAGPGTGKTELLSVRTANILRQTDVLPENILCLTFTESGAAAMRNRLVSIIGKDAYKVAIHTFHSFGSEIINQHGKFFYSGAHFRPADDLSRYEIIRSIFDQLGHSNALYSKMNGDYTYLGDTLTIISELKKSGLTSDELLEILDANDNTIQKVQQLLGPIFAVKPHKKMAEQLQTHVSAIRASHVTITLPNITSLAHAIADSLERAIEAAIDSGKTTPITAWRNAWFTKNDRNDFVLKSIEHQTKLRAVSSVYEQYLARMEEAELYDFDDMILRVVHGMEVFDELRFTLQEKYQYIMVDEFQDTNMAQMRIIHNLTNNQAHGDTPNIMVVGDDDQAIYSFQGADISNIINFRTMYPKVRIISLIDNYRSARSILSAARGIITQGNDRLESQPDLTISKQLIPRDALGAGSTQLYEADSISDERHWLIDSIQKSTQKLSDIAVLTRTHNDIEALLPYFIRAGIPVQYERRDNVLDIAPIILIEQVSRVLIGMYTSQLAQVNALLPELLSHPAWGITPQNIWKLSLSAYKNNASWLDEMATTPSFAPLHTWLVETAFQIPHTPLELLLDHIIGTGGPQAADTDHDDPLVGTAIDPSFRSPIYNYFFSELMLETRSEDYVRYLEALRAIRTKLRQYRPNETPSLFTFIEFIDLHRSIGSPIASIRSAATDDNAVQLMTAHKSKGLEFGTVYIMNAIESSWGAQARSRSRLIGYPENLPIATVGNSSDERLRLFYVAATRAKKTLAISYSTSDGAGKSLSRAGFLLDDSWKMVPITVADHGLSALESAQAQWYEPVTHTSHSELQALLAPQLQTYQLSVTHLTNFLDVTRDGPRTFLLHNLLRFPQAMTPASAYGSAIHQTLQRAHMHFSAQGKRQAVEDILQNFEVALTEKHLSQKDFDMYLLKGSEDLQAFLGAAYDTFTKTQKVELNFKSQHVIVGDAHLSGALDLVDIQDKVVTVTDYKTGKPARTWSGKTDYEKIKLHKYKQQLLFYKLLIEHARDYHDHTVEQGIIQFIEPTKTGDIVALTTGFDVSEQQRFILLLNAVWKRIISLDLPDVSGYDQSLKGILAFEQDLIDGTI